MNNNPNKPDIDDWQQRYENEQKRFNEQWKKLMPEFSADMPLWKQMVNSFRGTRYYPQFLMQNGSRAIVYFFFLILMVCIFSVIVPTVGTVAGMGGIKTYIQERIPEFSLKDGVLTSSFPLEYENAATKFYLDTDTYRYTKADVDDNIYMHILVSKTNALVYANGMVTDYNFADFKDLSFNKDMLIDGVPIIYLCLVLFCVIAYLMQAISTASTMLLLAVIGMLFNSFNGFGLRFGQLFTLAVYATTIVSMLEAVNAGLRVISAVVVSTAGMVWTAFVFFGALVICGVLKKGGQLRA